HDEADLDRAFGARVPTAKIQLKGQFAIDHERTASLSLQIVRQLRSDRSGPGGRRDAVVPATVAGFDLRSVMRAAQYPSRTIALRDTDGNPLHQLLRLPIHAASNTRQHRSNRALAPSARGILFQFR